MENRITICDMCKKDNYGSLPDGWVVDTKTGVVNCINCRLNDIENKLDTLRGKNE